MAEVIQNGAIKDPRDDRDFVFEKTLGSGEVMSDKEWKEGYDIEKIVGKIPHKNQWTSYSCVGQAYSYYIAVLNAIETGKLDIVSAKAIYSQITLGFAKGAHLRDGAKLAVNFGSLLESVVKSLRDNGTTDEAFMIDKSWITPEVVEMAKTLQAKSYYLIRGIGIDYFARAIKDGYGMVAGVEGTNNGTWTLREPQPPTSQTPQNQMWGHALYFGKFGVDEKGKYVECLNSWGNVGDNGWQKLRENWFVNEGRFIFNPWVLIDKPNNSKNNMKLVKSTDSTNTTVFLIDELGQRRVFFNEKHFNSVAPALGLAEKREDGDTDWSQVELMKESDIEKFPLANPLYEVNG